MNHYYKIKVKISPEVMSFSTTYCDHVNFLVDFLKPTDLESLNFFSKSFSEVKPCIKYILNPIRQNTHLSKMFLMLSEHRALLLLRDFCRKVQSHIVNYKVRENEVLLHYSPIEYQEKIDLNARVTEVDSKGMKVNISKRRDLFLMFEEPSCGGVPLLLNIKESVILFLVPNRDSVGHRLVTSATVR